MTMTMTVETVRAAAVADISQELLAVAAVMATSWATIREGSASTAFWAL